MEQVAASDGGASASEGCAAGDACSIERVATTEAFEEGAPSTSGRDTSKTRRDEQWEARRRYNNMRRREKTKEARQARNAAARAAEEALRADMTPEQVAERQAAKREERAARAAEEAAQVARVTAALAAGGPGGGPGAALRIAIDCSFSPSAPPKEMRSLCKQIENASATNKRAPRPACLTLTNWTPQLAAVASPCGGDGWRVVRMAEGPAEAFGAQRVVVLSPDATEPLLSVDSDRAYVIGGIVDRTHRKGLTLNFAESQRLECRRLPVAEYAEQLGLGKGTRKCPVLNIDDVVRALLIQHDTGDWVQALDAAIPSRKRKPQTMGFVQPPADPVAPVSPEHEAPEQDRQRETRPAHPGDSEKRVPPGMPSAQGTIVVGTATDGAGDAVHGEVPPGGGDGSFAAVASDGVSEGAAAPRAKPALGEQDASARVVSALGALTLQE